MKRKVLTFWLSKCSDCTHKEELQNDVTCSVTGEVIAFSVADSGFPDSCPLPDVE
jgi:hypothetical protein